jgi:hypothetical protein
VSCSGDCPAVDYWDGVIVKLVCATRHNPEKLAMLLTVLTWGAILFPVALSVAGIFVSVEDQKVTGKFRWLWRVGLFVVGGIGSAAVYYQQVLSGAQARESAKQDIDEAVAPLNSAIGSLAAQDKQLAAKVLSQPSRAPLVAAVAVAPRPLSSPGRSRLVAPAAPAPEQPHMASVRYSTRDVISTDEADPYEKQVIIQTTATIERAAFEVKADGPIDKAGFFVTGEAALMNVGWDYAENHTAYVFGFGFPSFQPDTPIVVTVFSKQSLAITSVTDARKR